jgi:hypothetical protein
MRLFPSWAETESSTRSIKKPGDRGLVDICNHNADDMRQKSRLNVIFAVALAVVATACVGRQGAGYQPGGVSAREALLRAVRVFPEDHYGSLRDYRIRFLPERTPREEWVIFFEEHRDVVRLGFDPYVVVNKKTGKVEFFHGK